MVTNDGDGSLRDRERERERERFEGRPKWRTERHRTEEDKGVFVPVVPAPF